MRPVCSSEKKQTRILDFLPDPGPSVFFSSFLLCNQIRNDVVSDFGMVTFVYYSPRSGISFGGLGLGRLLWAMSGPGCCVDVVSIFTGFTKSSMQLFLRMQFANIPPVDLERK